MGGSLGLPVETLPGYMPRSLQYPFVAVEFDIFTNKEESIDDPEWEHVGMNINSLKSKKNHALELWNFGRKTK